MVDKKYTPDEIRKIFQGYKMLDQDGNLSFLLKQVAACKKCGEEYPHNQNLPVNVLVRPLPLSKFVTTESMEKYRIRLRRDDTFLRNLLQQCSSISGIRERINSAKFAIGLLPWLDRCMLFRSTL